MLVPKDYNPVRTPNDVKAIERGCYFDPDEANFAVQFIEQFCIPAESKTPGLFTLIPWQLEFTWQLFGWRSKDGTRRFKSAYCEIPKKNGKSAYMSALALMLQLTERINVYIGACDREQASIVYNECEQMGLASPSIASLYQFISSRKRMVLKGTKRAIVALSADSKKHDGLGGIVIIDELHRHRSWDMWNVMRYAGIALDEPLTVVITTAGEDKVSPCWAQHERTRKVMSGEIEDITHYGVIYSIDDGADWLDPAQWRKANPAMGILFTEESFADDVQAALENPIELNNMRRLRLNMWGLPDVPFLDQGRWAACLDSSLDLSQFEGMDCYAGLDMSDTKDMSSLFLLFGNWDIGFTGFPYFWVPELAAEKRERINKILYWTWSQQGLMELCPGTTIDYDQVQAKIVELSKKLNIRRLYVDPRGAVQLVLQLQQAGLPVEMLLQTYDRLNGPMREIERLVLAGKFKCQDHAVMSWCVSNCVLDKNSQGYIKPSRKKSREKIDGVASMVDAVAAAIDELGQPPEDTGVPSFSWV